MKIIIQNSLADFYIGIREGSLQLKTGFLSEKTFYRKTNQAEWRSMLLGLGMSVLIRYEKQVLCRGLGYCELCTNQFKITSEKSSSNMTPTIHKSLP